MLYVSTIIVTWNRPEETTRAVESVTRQQYEHKEIIVWDNASEQTCFAKLQRSLAGTPGVTLIRSEQNLGPSQGRNCAVAPAKGDLLLFLDSDSELQDENALHTLCLGMQHFLDAAALNLEVFGPDGNVCWPFARDRRIWANRIFDIAHIDGCGVGFRREAFEEAGGFPSHFGYGAEEQYLARRCIASGWRILYFPRASVLHKKAAPGRIGSEFTQMLRNHMWIIMELYPLRWIPVSIVKTALIFLRDALRERQLYNYLHGLCAAMLGFRLTRRLPMPGERWSYYRGIIDGDRRLRAVASSH